VVDLPLPTSPAIRSPYRACGWVPSNPWGQSCEPMKLCSDGRDGGGFRTVRVIALHRLYQRTCKHVRLSLDCHSSAGAIDGATADGSANAGTGSRGCSGGSAGACRSVQKVRQMWG
jgi:hypothetical protein